MQTIHQRYYIVTFAYVYYCNELQRPPSVEGEASFRNGWLASNEMPPYGLDVYISFPMPKQSVNIS